MISLKSVLNKILRKKIIILMRMYATIVVYIAMTISELCFKIIRIINNLRFVKVVLITMRQRSQRKTLVIKRVKKTRKKEKANGLAIRIHPDLNKIHLILCSNKHMGKISIVHSQKPIIINSTIYFANNNNLISVSNITFLLIFFLVNF